MDANTSKLAVWTPSGLHALDMAHGIFARAVRKLPYVRALNKSALAVKARKPDGRMAATRISWQAAIASPTLRKGSQLIRL